MQNLSNFDAVLKNIYLGPIRNQLNSKTILLKRIERDEESVSGKNATISLNYGRNEGIGARADGGALPTAGEQSYKESIIPLKYNYGRIRITGPTIAASRDNKGAFVKAVDSEVKGMVRDLRADINRQLFGSGGGQLTLCALTTASTTVNVASTKYIKTGMIIDIKDSSGADTYGSLTVASITSSTAFVVSTTSVTSAITDGVYREDSIDLEMMGLKGAIDDGDNVSTFQGITRSSNLWWKSNVQESSSAGNNYAISEKRMQEAMDKAETEGDGSPSLLITTHAVRRNYVDILVGDKRFVNTIDLKGGFKALDFNGIPLVVDKDALANTMFFVDESTLKIYRASDFDWMDKDGAILSRVSNYDAYEAVLYLYANLGCDACNKSTVMRDITE